MAQMTATQGHPTVHVTKTPLKSSQAQATKKHGATPTATARSLRRRKSQATPASRRDKREAASPANPAHLLDNAQTRTATPPSHTSRRSSIRRRLFTMSSTTGKWREEQVLIVCPGSRMTMAQLGCSELTLPTRRMQTRMFKDGEQWAPHHRTKRTKLVNGQEEEEWVEDVDEDEGAVYPIQAGRIVNMEAFLAFLDHVHGLLTTTYHNTPIMLMASPQWTRPDCETIARYIFENTRTPALCIIHSGVATQYGLKWPNMTVVDIGFQKVDVTAIHDGRVANHMEVSSAGQSGQEGQISGGEVFTQNLLRLLKGKGFNHDMAEQLKKSSICEVLPYVGTAVNLMELPVGAVSEAAAYSAPDATMTTAIDAPKPLDEGENSNGNGDDDGVLDVATIVTTGQTKEFLAKKEKEKEKGKPGRKAKGDKDADAAANKPARLPNSKRSKNIFHFEEVILEEVPVPAKEPTANITNGPTEGEKKEGDANGSAAPPADDAAAKEAPKPEGEVAITENKPEEKTEAPAAAATSTNETPERRPKRVRRDIEVGLERFKFAERVEIDRIVNAIYRTIQGIDDMYMRPACWDNLVFVGNGSRLRGLKENILQTLTARHLVSPSTATMFTSELPSNMATPTGTGAQTPTGSFTGAPHQLSSSGVNPLLQAATTANAAAGGVNNAVATPQAGSEAGGPAVGHHFHSQTPTSIKTAALPTYLSEWTKNGFEESMFLGAQVAARIAFCLHTNMDAQAIEAQRLMSLSRVDYNELGPKGIRTHSMLG